LAERFPPEQASQVAALMLEGEEIPEEGRERMMMDCLSHQNLEFLTAQGVEVRP